MLKRQEELQQQIKDLMRKLTEALRAAKRQAAPFARRTRQSCRKKPGRKIGHPGAHQAVPDHVDKETFEPLVACPCCGGAVDDVTDHEQFVVDLPKVRAHVHRIVTQSGNCARCRRRVRSQHPDQVSTAAGAARVALGPNVLGLATDLKHRYGMAYRKVADLIATYFGIRITHGAFVQSSVRLAKLGEVTYLALIATVRASPVVHTDDTGWRIDGESTWLWVFATEAVTVYVIARSRGSDVVLGVLGADFAGRLVSDGLPALDALDGIYARAQCLGHLIVRASELASLHKAGAARMPLAVKGLLQDVIALRGCRDDLAASTYRRKCRGVEQRLDRLLAGHSTVTENEKLRRHMVKHRDQLLVTLDDPAVPPTNNLAEQRLRGAVVVRKLGGCNRSDEHAWAHAIHASVAQTAHCQGFTFTDFVRGWLRPRAGPQDALRAIAPDPTITPRVQHRS
ncbi:MAG: IS66 family transposase [Burkholderiales bacterium]